jgi:chemotaxis protein CheD
MSLLITRVLELGGRRSRLLAKVFGGACVLEAFRADGESLGARNVEVARERLRERGIPVVGEDVGGDHGRKVVFHVRTGGAWVRAVEMKD